MKSTVETLSPTRVRLAIEVPFAELEPSLRKAYREIAAQVTIPGFRKGKVPTAVIDQRFGRGAVLNEAIQDAIPNQIVAAVREHEVQTLGQPSVEITELTDGEALKFTAELDVRPDLTLPDLATIEVTVDELKVGDEEIDEQVNTLRDRFAKLKTVERAAQIGDYVQIDLVATVGEEEVPGGTATNISHEVGSNQLLPELDEILVGMGAGDATTFTSQLAGGDLAGQEANVAVTVRTVKEKQVPPLDDDFAQLASEFDTLGELREDLAIRLTKIRRMEQLFTARDKALAALVESAAVPAPEGVVAEEVKERKQVMIEELERVGATLAQYLSAEGKTEQDMEAELTEAATEGVKIQLVLDKLAEQEQVQVSNDEFGHEIVHRAERAGKTPQAFYDQLVRSGMAGVVFGDVRRGKALGLVMERVKITDTAGTQLSMEDLRGGSDADEHEHDH